MTTFKYSVDVQNVYDRIDHWILHQDEDVDDILLSTKVLGIFLPSIKYNSTKCLMSDKQWSPTITGALLRSCTNNCWAVIKCQFRNVIWILEMVVNYVHYETDDWLATRNWRSGVLIYNHQLLKITLKKYILISIKCLVLNKYWSRINTGFWASTKNCLVSNRHHFRIMLGIPKALFKWTAAAFNITCLTCWNFVQ